MSEKHDAIYSEGFRDGERAATERCYSSARAAFQLHAAAALTLVVLRELLRDAREALRGAAAYIRGNRADLVTDCFTIGEKIDAALAKPCAPADAGPAAHTPQQCRDASGYEHLARDSRRLVGCTCPHSASEHGWQVCREDGCECRGSWEPADGGEWELVGDHTIENLTPLASMGACWQPGDRVRVYRRRAPQQGGSPDVR